MGIIVLPLLYHVYTSCLFENLKKKTVQFSVAVPVCVPEIHTIGLILCKVVFFFPREMIKMAKYNLISTIRRLCWYDYSMCIVIMKYLIHFEYQTYYSGMLCSHQHPSHNT